ncbi:MAG: type II secretion system F family protein [Candidatus Nitrosocaldus sp.]
MISKSIDNRHNILLDSRFKFTIIGSAVCGVIIAMIIQQSNNLLIALLIGIIIGITPLVIRTIYMNRILSSIDKNIPHMLNLLLESTKNGLNIITALNTITDIRSSQIRIAVKRLLINIASGTNISNALDRFEADMITPLGKSVANVIRILIINGGNIPLILERTYKSVYAIYLLEEERKAKLASYKSIIYISYVIYVAIAVMLSTNLFDSISNINFIEVSEMNNSNNNSSSNSSNQLFRLDTINIDEMREIMLHMGIIQAIFGGLGIGKICEGSALVGIRHIVSMLAICLVGFYIGGVI